MMDEEAYRFIEIAQCEGSYPELLSKIAPQVLRDTKTKIATELELIRQKPDESRLHEINSILKYWSRARETRIKEGKLQADSSFEETSLNLTRASKYNNSDFEKGLFNPESLASRLIDACCEYDRDVIAPLTQQIGDQLRDNFPDANLLFLGRDFTSVYLYLYARETLPRERLFLANVSRNIRDGCLEDVTGKKLHELRDVLWRVGLTPSVILKRPLVIVDSSMKGKIPAVIFQALSIGMNDTDAFHFLRQCHIRYIRSGRHKGKELHVKAKELGEANHDMISVLQRKELLKTIEFIEEFKKIQFPTQVASFIPRRHKIFEWRPKALQVATATIARDPSFISDFPKSPNERVMCILGLLLDVRMQEMGKRHPDSVSIGAPSTSIATLANIKQEIETVSTRGLEAIRTWQRKGPKGCSRISIVETKDNEVPYELYLDKKPMYRLRSIAGEGNNVLAYVTEQNTVLKVTKKPTHARKNLLLAWAENLVRDNGLEVAPVLQVGPDGLYVEQEYIPGENLETRFSESFEANPESVPQDIIEQVLEIFERASHLVQRRGIYLDIKSANYQLRENGHIVNVDYTPRVNKTYYRYFKKDDGGPLSKSEFLDMFFCHDRRKKCLRK